MKLLDTFFLMRTGSVFVARFLHRSKIQISPNWFTFLSSALFIIALYLAFYGDYFSIPVIILSIFFDFLDGEYARVTEQTSNLGRIFDEVSDTAKIPLLVLVYFYSSTAPLLVIVLASLWMTFLRLKLLIAGCEAISAQSMKGIDIQKASILRRLIATVPQLYYANIEIVMIYLIVSDDKLLGWIFAILMFYNLCRLLKRYFSLVFN